MSSLKPCGCENPDTKELESTTICTNCGFVSLTRDWNRISLLEKKLGVAVAALGWYADKQNYVVSIKYDEKMKPISSHNPISETGTKAREALETIRNLHDSGDQPTGGGGEGEGT